jgi:hypothetical protein
MNFLLGDDSVPIDKKMVNKKLLILTPNQRETVVKKAQETAAYLNKKTRKTEKVINIKLRIW